MDLFSTHIHEIQLQDADGLWDSIINHVKEEREKTPHSKRNRYSLTGEKSYHSEDNLVALEGVEWSNQLKLLCYKATEDYAKFVQKPILPIDQVFINCWCMIMGRGSYSIQHSHPGAIYSGVFWIQVPTDMPKDQGQFVVVDPRQGARLSMFNPEGWDVQPTRSHGLVFDSWVEHLVQPHFIDGERISISWNVAF
tara:strand:+ start:1135 stop:1719 length:585 start_codon:yes stop_codon:yes gene_type:complete